MSVTDKLKKLKQQSQSGESSDSGSTDDDKKGSATTIREKKVKTPCEYCSNEYVNINAHLNKCPQNPNNAQQSTPSLDIDKIWELLKPRIESILSDKMAVVNDIRGEIPTMDSIKKELMYSEENIDLGILKEKINSVNDAWEEIREPAFKRWQHSSGYDKITHRLDDKMKQLLEFVFGKL